MDPDDLDELAMHIAASDDLSDGLSAGFASIQKDHPPDGNASWLPWLAALAAGLIVLWLLMR